MSRSRTRWGVALAVAGLVAGGTSATAAPAPTAAPPTTAALPTAPPPTTGTPGGDLPRTVTLVTGDRVVVAGDRLVSVTPGPGREDLVFHRFHRDGHLHVVPRDAARPLAEDRLDLRLFDVTGLVEAGYDDARRDTVPLIVTGTSASGARVTRSLAALGAVAAEAPKSATALPALLADPGVTKVWLDGKREPTLDRSTAQIGAPTAWAAGYTGAGVKVAVVDSGVDQDHPDLVGRQVAERNFTGDPDATDLVGHGTHVASTVASTRAPHRGVAPDAQIIDAKVCSVAACQESWIVDGMTWAVEQGADVLNVSLGGTDAPGLDPLEQAVEALSASSGALFVIAAGNSGRPGTIGSPGSAESALTVGAVDRDDSIAPFSSRGPRVGDGAPKPDVTAPGVGIVAAEANSGGDHVAASGTSMATPHVAGAAALLAQQHPDWTGARIKAALMASAEANPELTAFDQGAGRVDLAQAITAAVVADPPSLSFGSQPWPHDDDTPVTKQLTLHNTGPRAVTAPVTVEATGPDGKPAPAGLFTAEPATAAIPAGGRTTVTVTADTRAGTLDGAYSGAVVVGDALRAPIGVDREQESYDITARFVDATGGKPFSHSGVIIGLDNAVFTFLDGDSGAVTTRLPKGEYTAQVTVVTGDEENPAHALLPRPSLSVTKAETVVFDARAAKPVEVTAPDPGATPSIADIGVTRTRGDRRTSVGSAFIGGFPESLTLAHTGPALPDDELAVSVGAQYEGVPVGDTPVNYRFAWIERGEVPTGFVRAPARRDLAEVRTALGPVPGGRRVLHGGMAVNPDSGGGWATLFPVPPGGEVVDLVTVEDFTWTWVVLQVSGDFTVEADYEAAGDRPYRAGRTYRERFLSPVFGPGLPGERYTYAGRLGDEVQVGIPLLNDSANHLGGSAYATARTALYRDGVEVGSTARPNGVFTVPTGPAGYRIEADLTRAPGVSEFATRVSGRWTFRSDTVTGERVKPLPLSVVRFTPELDATGGTPAGRVLRVPLTVEQQHGADAGRVRGVRVEVSFDDGESWSAVPVVGNSALVRNPAGAGFAALRAKGTDSRGNTFEHSVLRAYRITG
ncbi:S8 family serine peptidase [Saccharothrix yanglingensis]|uniref:Peptidase S8 n=1 Tax=Saccharothrix yanglingensis TaxID=659496 RepID=A0ABU0X9L6_9PSEU|nr:S8 family serine peptidase [Saccharothrix yanglingensis]MDQ2588651.1 peptidase S8 [Saccharothrix yanglingensis]